MTKKMINVAMLFSALFLFSCGGEKNPEVVRTEESLRAEIKSMEDSLFAPNATLDKESAEKIIALYIDFANEFPKAKDAPDFLLKAADVATAINKPRIKEDSYKKIINNYPDFPKMEAVKYLLAFTLDAELDKRDEAKEWYNEVVHTVKDTNFVRDSKVRLKSIDSLNYDQFVQMIINQNMAAQAAPLPQ